MRRSFFSSVGRAGVFRVFISHHPTAIIRAAESAGVLVKRGNKLYKQYRGMGSRSAMSERSGSRLRYNASKVGSDLHSERLTRDEKTKVVPEGVAGLVEVVGPLESLLTTLMGGVAGGFAHAGAANVYEFQRKHEFWMQSSIGAVEGSVHDIREVTE